MHRALRRAAVLALLSTPILLGASPAHAFWCDGSLVLVGDRAYEVRDRCGEPASVISRTDVRTEYVGGGVVRGGILIGGVTRSTSVLVEIWVYDFGRTRFMEELRFEDGVLRAMTRLGPGRRRSELSPGSPHRLARGLAAGIAARPMAPWRRFMG